MTFDLPMPPSSNMLFSTYKGRRIITREYKAWKIAAAETLMAQYAAYGSPSVHRPVEMQIRLGMGYRGDIANREKALTDLLVANIDMPDDRYIERLVIERDQGIEGAIVAIGTLGGVSPQDAFSAANEGA